MSAVYLITTDGTMENTYSEDTGAVLNGTSKIGKYLKFLCPQTVTLVYLMRES